MIFQNLKKITLLLVLVSGLIGCDQFSLPFANPTVNSANKAAKTAYNRTGYKTRVGSTDSKGMLAGLDSADPPLPVGGTGNLWDRLRSNFQLPPSDNQPAVQAQINWFMHNQSYLDRTLARAAPFMYYIFSQTQQRNIPAELVLLPVIESAYNPLASSYKGAVGLWQLMPSTASGFGIKQDWWYDGRKDIFASTNAALDYLTYLQNYFGGDWLLAIAAYDAGEGSIQSAIRRNADHDRATGFWSLPLPMETRSYVPRLLALADIIRDPAKYHVSLPPISDAPYLMQVDIGAPINLSQAAKLAGMSLAELKQLNPAYHGATTDPHGPYKLILPIDRIALFKEQLAAAPNLSVETWARYKVRRGDTLTSIAKKYHTTVAKLRESNQLRGYTAPVGRVIVVPTGTEAVVPQVAASSSALGQAAASENAIASAGSDLVAAATAATSTSTTTQMQAAATDDQDDDADNDTRADTASSPQQETAAVAEHSPSKQVHVVKRGETLGGIAHHYRVRTSDLERWNKLKSARALKPGQHLTIWMAKASSDEDTDAQPVATPKSVTKKSVAKSTNTHQQVAQHHTGATARSASTSKSTASSGSARHYTVQAGDSLYTIARHLGVTTKDLQKWNHLSGNKLKPGQRLVVYTPAG